MSSVYQPKRKELAKVKVVDTEHYTDHKNSFSDKVYTNWRFDKNDKRKIKKIKNRRVRK